MITLLAWLYVKVDILLTYVKHMNDRIISLQWNVWSQTTSLSTAHIMQVSVPDKRLRIPKGQSKKDNPEKLTT
jgi:hypothetical protein